MGYDFDVIVVGAGPAGCTAAKKLVQSGVEVALIERGPLAGSKNVSGGVLYLDYIPGYTVLDVFPDFAENGPVERRIVSHEVLFVSAPTQDKDSVSYKFRRVDEHSFLTRIGITGFKETGGRAYSVLRAKMDRWMAARVQEAGGVVNTCTTVEHLLFEDGRVVGVRTSDEELRSKLVIDASGVTSNLVTEAGLRSKLEPYQVYHGVKHVFKLKPELIEERFGVKPGEGKAIYYIGPFMRGVSGGAFIYTNRDTLSVGIVASLDSYLRRAFEDPANVGKPMDLLEEFEEHPVVSQYLEGAELVEYSAHNIPKGHKTFLEKPFRAGYLVTGDALGAFVKIGGLIDGMRRAIATGIMAAEVALRCVSANRFDAEALAPYQELLKPIYRDVKRSSTNSVISEGRIGYELGPRLLLAAGGVKVRGVAGASKRPNVRDSIKRVQELTAILQYDEDHNYSHIKVDVDAASAYELKQWVPACPVNCYTILLDKGVFASYRDLYLFNLERAKSEGLTEQEARMRAVRETLNDIAKARLRFDYVACVACGTCGVIGPQKVVDFGHERRGHGVTFRYG
ncbi:MAG: FAD-dependent oxidoreductase [Thaumarchaeota archaeon]|nr:FAD-dependent oxidoreductase [Candidatus Calditenuaceae archaeon]MDW8186863.1 FAD-dependent oxidoreductase [Nitrososphaerota archaeon]